jgi:hypothetical protein
VCVCVCVCERERERERQRQRERESRERERENAESQFVVETRAEEFMSFGFLFFVFAQITDVTFSVFVCTYLSL